MSRKPLDSEVAHWEVGLQLLCGTTHLVDLDYDQQVIRFQVDLMLRADGTSDLANHLFSFQGVMLSKVRTDGELTTCQFRNDTESRSR